MSKFGAKCTMRKGLKKRLTPGSLAPVHETTRVESQVNGMFLKRRHFGPGTGQWKGEIPERGVMDDGGSVASGRCRLPGSWEPRLRWKFKEGLLRLH
jgi:hypothetical protein